MLDNIAGLIVFLIIIGVVVGLILIGRFIASKFFGHKRENICFEDGASSNAALDFWEEQDREITGATLGEASYACSIYYKDPKENEDDGT